MASFEVITEATARPFAQVSFGARLAANAIRLDMPGERLEVTIRRLSVRELRVQAVHHGKVLQCRNTRCHHVAIYVVDFRARSENRKRNYSTEFCEKHALEVATAYNLELPE